MIVVLQSRNTLTIPRELREALDLEPGCALEMDIEDGRLVVTPVAVVPKTLRLTASGEAKEAEADEDIRAGRVASYATAEALIADLDR